MRSTLAYLAVLGLALTGCGSARAAGFHQQLDFAVAAPGLRVGEARVVGEGVNPLAPVTLSADRSAIAVAFGQLHRGAVVRLDPGSMEALERIDGPVAPRGPLADGVARVALKNGTFVVCSREGTVELGYRAVAQAYSAGGAPIGAAVTISPPDVDVIGAPRAASVDGQRVIATFTAMRDAAFELVAVPLEVL